MKHFSITDSQLYLILDASVNTYDELFEILRKTMPQGIDIVQIRDKGGTARDIVDFSRRALDIIRGRIPFIVNDRVDIAVAVGADGVHLGQEDLPVGVARKMLGADVLIGVSAQTKDHAYQAQKDGADYIGFGSVYKTETKPEREPLCLDLLGQVCRSILIPTFAIGGITRERIPELYARGIKRVAVCREICLNSQPENVVSQLKEILGHSTSDKLTARY